MKKAIKWWALKNPKGGIILSTIQPTKNMSWENGFWSVAEDQGDDWRERFWKRWNPSMNSAIKLGYKFVRVKITETK